MENTGNATVPNAPIHPQRESHVQTPRNEHSAETGQRVVLRGCSTTVPLCMQEFPGRERELGGTNINEQINDIRRAQLSLSQRVTELREEFSTSSRLLLSASHIASAAEKMKNEGTLQRLLLFASPNPRKVLSRSYPDFSRSVPNPCPGNTVVQVVLRSKASDCTLHEFQVLLNACSDNSRIRCSVYPSEFHAKFPDPSSSARFDIGFDTYSGICEALGINARLREQGLYREKKNSARKLNSVQVAGVATNDTRTRRVLLGRSMPTRTVQSSAHTLFQASLAWNESTWETGFVHRFENLNLEISRPQQSRFSDINMPPPDSRVFRITWERNPGAFDSPGIQSDMVAGSLRSNFPAVIIRSRILTESARSILMSRIDGFLLKQIIASAMEPTTIES